MMRQGDQYGVGYTPADDNDAGYNSVFGLSSTKTLSQAGTSWWRIQAVTTSVKQW